MHLSNFWRCVSWEGRSMTNTITPRRNYLNRIYGVKLCKLAAIKWLCLGADRLHTTDYNSIFVRTIKKSTCFFSAANQAEHVSIPLNCMFSCASFQAEICLKKLKKAPAAKLRCIGIEMENWGFKLAKEGETRSIANFHTITSLNLRLHKIMNIKFLSSWARKQTVFINM